MRLVLRDYETGKDIRIATKRDIELHEKAGGKVFTAAVNLRGRLAYVVDADEVGDYVGS